MKQEFNAPNEWQCSHCKQIYTFKEFITLKSEWIDPNRTEYGKTTICRNCGKPFHKNKWQQLTKIKTFPNLITCLLHPVIRVSTVHLELNHFGYWYETMVFADKRWSTIFNVEVYVQIRYKTQEEAEKGHKEIVNKLKRKMYSFKKNENGFLELKLQ